MKFLVATGLMALALSAQAGCIGTDAFQSCTDNSGNSYTVNRIGGTTMLNGSNSQTGSTWSQTSNTIGNTTMHNGTASNGNSWNSTTQNFGNMQIHSGSDSNGKSFNRTCVNGVCN